MATTVRSKQGETVDLICWRHYGRVLGIVERVLEANRGLCEHAAVLPIGTRIVLPDLPAPASVQAAPLQRLWD